ncbi:MAG: hypothetical protein ACRDBO_16200 [Lachnospiraceae bacterium]
MYELQPDVLAEITSCRESPVYNGYRPAHLIGDYLTTGSQTYIDREFLHKGETGRGYITFLSPEFYPNSLSIGDVLSFQEGSRITGYAKILEIYNPVLVRDDVEEGETK